MEDKDKDKIIAALKKLAEGQAKLLIAYRLGKRSAPVKALDKITEAKLALSKLGVEGEW